jgi:hypothetical protein
MSVIDHDFSSDAARTNAADVVRDQVLKLADDLPTNWPFIVPVKGAA